MEDETPVIKIINKCEKISDEYKEKLIQCSRFKKGSMCRTVHLTIQNRQLSLKSYKLQKS